MGTSYLQLKLLLSVAFLALCAACAGDKPPPAAQGDKVTAAEAKGEEPATAVPYEVEIEGIDSLSSQFEAVSRLVSLQDKPPPSEAALRRRAEDDVPRLLDVLHSAGYWEAKVGFEIAEKEDPQKIKVKVEPGPLYVFRKVEFQTSSGEKLPLDPLAFGLGTTKPARSDVIVEAEGRVIADYSRHGRPYARIADRKAVIDIATHSMDLTYVVDPGPDVRFGAATVTGTSKVEKVFVERKIRWQEGEPYDSRKVDQTQQSLVKSGLFSTIKIEHPTEASPNGEVPMAVAVTERPVRSIGAGVDYNTSQGLGGRAYWEHRNLFGQGEQLRVTTILAQQQYGAAVNFRKPDFHGVDQDFLANAEFANETPDAYTSRREKIFTGLERRYFGTVTTSLGLQFEHARITESAANGSYSLVGLPFTLKYDGTDDLLDPTKGKRAAVTATPYRSIAAGPDLAFLSTRFSGSLYKKLGNDDQNRYVLAAFGALGSIAGASRNQVPIDKRLYAGGGGSVRGFGYQKAGPVDTADRPLGGVSSLELGLELRYKITETIGIVPFLEAGNVYPDAFPTNFTLFYGAGIGVRYYTAIGPIRLDIATPLNGRSFDSPIQFYISLGQAF